MHLKFWKWIPKWNKMLTYFWNFFWLWFWYDIIIFLNLLNDSLAFVHVLFRMINISYEQLFTTGIFVESISFLLFFFFIFMKIAFEFVYNVHLTNNIQQFIIYLWCGMAVQATHTDKNIHRSFLCIQHFNIFHFIVLYI